MRKEYARRHYALHHAPVEFVDEERYDGARTVGKTGRRAYLVRGGDEESAVLVCHCGAIGDTNNVAMKPLCVAHGGYQVYYSNSGWMNLGDPSTTPWFLSFESMARERFPDVESVTTVARRDVVGTRDPIERGLETDLGTFYRHPFYVVSSRTTAQSPAPHKRRRVHAQTEMRRNLWRRAEVQDIL
jgi:hypothetical protein